MSGKSVVTFGRDGGSALFWHYWCDMARMQNLLALLAALIVLSGPAAADIELFGSDPLFAAIRAQNLPEVEALAIRGENLEIRGLEDRTPIIYAALLGNPDIIVILIRNRARVDHRDKLGNTALFYAASRGDLDSMQVLLEATAKPDLENRQGMTPMMTAASKGHVNAVQLLLDNRADATRRDYTGRTAMMWAEWNRRPNVVALLRNAGIRE